MVPLIIVMALAVAAQPSVATEPGTETTRHFLALCDEDLDRCRQYLNEFILGGTKLYPNTDVSCIPLERNKAADKMLGLMRDPEFADWEVGDGLMQSMTDAFPCLTGN